MSKNLIIVGAGSYGVVVSEIAADVGCFEKIAFLDDESDVAANGVKVLGTTRQLNEFASDYSDIIVAIGNPEKRLSLLNKIEHETSYNIAVLVSPNAYVSPSATIEKGSIIEPMAVVHTGCVISSGCIISAGAVVNHFSTCGMCVHVDCNAIVEGYAFVPSGTKVCNGEVFK